MHNLILTICSNYKETKGEVKEYDADARKITDVLPGMREKINDARSRAFTHITHKDREREWKFFSTVPVNKDLQCGPDINQSSEKLGLYMPALKRYRERFYTNFGSAIDDIDACIKRLSNPSENHLLIVSGLYGLLAPTEPIQNYNCNVPEERKIKHLWKEGDLLTELVIAYMNECKIDRVFDFMAEESYRHLIDWEKIEEKTTDSKVFYSVSSSPREGEQIGVNLLPRLGSAASLFLSKKPEPSLSDIRFGHTIRPAGIRFRSSPPEWIPAGASLSKRETYAVWALRMVANVGEFLDSEGIQQTNRSGKPSLASRIDLFSRECRAEDKRIGITMFKINRFRNDLVHEYVKSPTPTQIDNARKNYKKIVDWAKGKGYTEPEDVDY